MKKSKPDLDSDSPTNIGGWNPDKEGRFIVDTTHGVDYMYDGKPVSLKDGFGALCGLDSIPARIRTAFVSPREETDAHASFCGIHRPDCEVCTCGKE